jgi:hypothetical protein
MLQKWIGNLRPLLLEVYQILIFLDIGLCLSSARQLQGANGIVSYVTILDCKILEIGLKQNIPLPNIAADLEFTRTSFDRFYCCTVHFDDSITFIHKLMHLYIYYQSLKHFVHLIAPTCFDTQRVIIRELYFPG